MKKKILFVCLGNICRSPAAEGIMKALVEKAGRRDDFEIDSAGIGDWHVGQLPDRRMRDHGRRHSYDFSSRARQVKPADFDRFDVIVGMDAENIKSLRRLAPSKEAAAKIVLMADYLTRHPNQPDVPDPYYGSDSGFELVIELLEDACSSMLAKL